MLQYKFIGWLYPYNVSKFNGYTQGCWEDCRHANTKVGPIDCARGGWGHASREFWDFTCSKVCSGGLLRLLFVHAYTTYMFRMVAQPSSHCATGHPAVQQVIPLCNWIRFLPRSKPFACIEVFKERHISFLPPSLMKSVLEFLFIQRSLTLLQGNCMSTCITG